MLLFHFFIANYEQIGEANGQKDKEEKNKFFVEISEGLYEFDNDFGRAKKGEFNVVYDYYRNSRNKSESEAAKLAKDYVLGGMVRLDTNYGVTYVSPNHLMGEFEASGDTAMNARTACLMRRRRLLDVAAGPGGGRERLACAVLVTRCVAALG